MTLRAELQAALDDMAQFYAAGDAVACAALFTTDATLVSSYGPPAQGRAAIAALHRDWTKAATAKTFEILDCGGGGETAWALARFSEGRITGAGTTLAVFERRECTGWLVRVCSLNSAET